jgi:hypothetical protein
MGLVVLTDVFVHKHQKGILHLRFENCVVAKRILDHTPIRLEHLK